MRFLILCVPCVASDLNRNNVLRNLKIRCLI